MTVDRGGALSITVPRLYLRQNNRGGEGRLSRPWNDRGRISLRLFAAENGTAKLNLVVAPIFVLCPSLAANLLWKPVLELYPRGKRCDKAESMDLPPIDLPPAIAQRPKRVAPLKDHLDPSRRNLRSKVTNGEAAYVVGNGCSPWARRQRDLIAIHAQDAGGLETISAARLSLCHRAAALQVQLELMEGQLSLGAEVDMDLYGRLSGHLRRILETIGVDRVAKTVPTLDGYLQARAKPERPAPTIEGYLRKAARRKRKSPAPVTIEGEPHAD
jgi:hypothetical protein